MIHDRKCPFTSLSDTALNLYTRVSCFDSGDL